MDLHAGIAMDVKKLVIIMRPICKYYNSYKNQQLLLDLYTSIAMVVKKLKLL